MRLATHASLDLFMDLVQRLSSFTDLASPDAPSTLYAIQRSGQALSIAFGLLRGKPAATNVAKFLPLVAFDPPTSATPPLTPDQAPSAYRAAAHGPPSPQSSPTRLPILGRNSAAPRPAPLPRSTPRCKGA